MVQLVEESSFTVQLFDTDIHGTLSVRGLWDFLQEAAGNHTETLGVAPDEMRRRGLAWILTRLRMSVERYPALGETVTVRTWPSGIDRLLTTRDFSMRDEGGTVIARAVSGWIALDLGSKRPVRIQSIFDPPGMAELPRALAADLGKLPGAGSAESQYSVPVRFGDLDANQHVSNSRYVEWVVESAGPQLLKGSAITDLGIDFLAETIYGGEVIVRIQRGVGAEPGAGAGSTQRLEHAVVHAADGVEAARARTDWRPL